MNEGRSGGAWVDASPWRLGITCQTDRRSRHDLDRWHLRLQRLWRDTYCADMKHSVRLESRRWTATHTRRPTLKNNTTPPACRYTVCRRRSNLASRIVQSRLSYSKRLRSVTHRHLRTCPNDSLYPNDSHRGVWGPARRLFYVSDRNLKIPIKTSKTCLHIVDSLTLWLVFIDVWICT